MGVGEDRESFSNLPDSYRGAGIRARDVGVIFADQRLIGAGDRLVLGMRCDPQHVVGVESEVVGHRTTGLVRRFATFDRDMRDEVFTGG